METIHFQRLDGQIDIAKITAKKEEFGYVSIIRIGNITKKFTTDFKNKDDAILYCHMMLDMYQDNAII